MTEAIVAGGVWEKLRAGMTGRLLLPSEDAAAYDRARRPYMSQFDAVRPRAVAACATVEDVAACVRFAREHGLPVAVRSGGHSGAGYSTTEGLVVDVSGLDAIGFGGGTVTLGAGLRFAAVLDALSPRGLVLPGGMNPTVGLGGFLQGGGFGLLTRAYGMACDRVVSAEVVLADGSVLRCSAEADPDLYWAVRGGGGGNFGVATRFEVAPVELSRMVNYTLGWSWEDALAVFAGWQRWALGCPRELGSSLLFVLPDAAPGNLPTVSVIGGWTGEAARLEAILDEFVAAAGRPPILRDVRPLTYHAAMTQWYNPPGAQPRSGYQQAKNRLFDREIPESALARVLAAFDADRAAGHTRVLNAYLLGGQANEPARTASAYVHRDTAFLLAVGDTVAAAAPDQAVIAASTAWVEAAFLTYDGLSNGESYQNYIDPRLADWRTAYYAENYDRLVAVKNTYDPDRFFDFPQAIGAVSVS
jgi:FAD/FMN-containing dehydrogenase